MPNKTVLIVDDEPNIILSIDFNLKKNGYNTLIARNGAEPLKILQETQPNLILLDIMMPNVDGYEVCKFVKTNLELKHIKVVFVSAKSKEIELKAGFEIGADDYITKPFSNKVLIQRVQALLND